MRDAAAFGLIALLLGTTAYATPAPKRDPERLCIATSVIAIDQGMMSRMWDDAGLVKMICSVAVIAFANAAKGEPYAECDKLRLALAAEAKRRGLDMKAVGQKCADEIDRHEKKEP